MFGRLPSSAGIPPSKPPSFLCSHSLQQAVQVAQRRRDDPPVKAFPPRISTSQVVQVAQVRDFARQVVVGQRQFLQRVQRGNPGREHTRRDLCRPRWMCVTRPLPVPATPSHSPIAKSRTFQFKCRAVAHQVVPRCPEAIWQSAGQVSALVGRNRSADHARMVRRRSSGTGPPSTMIALSGPSVTVIFTMMVSVAPDGSVAVSITM